MVIFMISHVAIAIILITSSTHASSAHSVKHKQVKDLVLVALILPTVSSLNRPLPLPNTPKKQKEVLNEKFSIYLCLCMTFRAGSNRKKK